MSTVAVLLLRSYTTMGCSALPFGRAVDTPMWEGLWVELAVVSMAWVGKAGTASSARSGLLSCEVE